METCRQGGAEPGTRLGVARKGSPGGSGRGQGWNGGWEEGKYYVPPAPQVRKFWGDPLTLNIAWAGHWQDPQGGRTPGQQGCVTQSHPLARAGSGLLLRNPKDGLFPPESGPQGLRPQGLVVSGAPLTWNPVFPEGSQAAPPLPGSGGGLQATYGCSGPDSRCVQRHSGLCGPGLVHRPRLSPWSRGALWWPMGPTSEAVGES